MGSFITFSPNRLCPRRFYLYALGTGYEILAPSSLLRGPSRVAYSVGPCILSAGWDTRSKFVAPLWLRVSYQLWPLVSYQLDVVLPRNSLPRCGLVYPISCGAVYPISWMGYSLQVRCLVVPFSMWPCCSSCGPVYPISCGSVYAVSRSSMAPCSMSPCPPSRGLVYHISCGPVYRISWMGYSLQVCCPVCPVRSPV